MHVDDGEEDGDPLALAAHEVRLRGRADHIHLAVRRGHHEVGARRHPRVRVPEEVEREDREQHPDRDQHRISTGVSSHSHRRDNGDHRRGKSAQRPDHHQRNQREQDQLKGRLPGFARVFHAAQG